MPEDPGGGTGGLCGLYELHWDAGVAFACSLVRHHADAEDLVSHSFVKILSALKEGKGPVGPFRPYLYRVIRTSAADHWNRTSKEQPVASIPEAVCEDPGLARVEEAAECGLAACAFASLPARWQEVLRLLDIQGLRPREAAPVLGIEPNAVSALARRARRGLRVAYLTAYAETEQKRECQRFARLLARVAVGASSAGEQAKLNQHLPGCSDCTRALARLRQAHDEMRTL
ncbi:sigma-70 family RNA polymerase sigma factor [Arthrobacter sp. ISL-48]|uniref:RNA polymerase sigma factor n=1 Tax=Arthrobacter sp. ISL-48 TaxID=2819110 RepID=UPI001BECC4D6|nr:sigma-70 family RNA polymerase sigma factor [Arthrobacter sp. ISL-48]MBT2533581.1 sigma-70 family RNA polymerase sigma factor [Arthrobacter sp. ISL-48]